MNINFLGPVFPTDPYAQMAFVEILNTLLVANNIMEVNRMLIHRNANLRTARCRDISDVVICRQPFHAVAACGIQFPGLFRTTHIQYPFRNAGKPGRERDNSDT